MPLGPEVYAVTSWMPQREAPVSRDGVVSAKMPQAAGAGIAMLERGGNAIDAAVATAFAVGVCEPWMNGIGGGGYMVIWLAEAQRSVVIDFAMRAPLAATPHMYPLDPAATPDDDFFGWPAVEGNRHTSGPHSVAVPGTVAGLTTALEQFGTLSLSDVLQPAIDLAEHGFPVTWQITTTIAKNIGLIRPNPATCGTFLTASGEIPAASDQTRPPIIRQSALAATLRDLAAGGADAFYRGEIGKDIVAFLRESGSILTEEDFATYEARVLEPIALTYHDHTVYTTPNGSGGASLAQALMALNLLESGAPQDRSVVAWHRMAQVFRQAFADRFAYLADPDQVEVPLTALLADDYARETVDAIDDASDPRPQPASRERLGVMHDLEGSVPEYARDGSTTHLGVIDGAGNAVSLTQTLLGVFGSGVTIPERGILMNNGMMWFDPIPNRPNSVAGGKRPLSNMAPCLIVKDNEIVASVGASGGRKIMNCNAQIVMNIVDSGMGAQEAIDAPRIDASTRDLAISMRVPQETRDGLAALGHHLSLRHEGLLTTDFSSPIAIRRTADGQIDGGADPWMFGATAIGVPKKV